MKFNYQSDGDILYGVENFVFRLQGRETAEITLMHMIDDDQYAFDIAVTDPYAPEDFKRIVSSDSALFESLGIEFRMMYKSKQEALQHAIDVVNAVMNKAGR